MNRRDFLKLSVASASAPIFGVGCAGVKSAGGGEVMWAPTPSPKRVKVVQWGVRHEHASGKFKSLNLLKDDFELVGLVDDCASKTLAEGTNFKPYKGVPILTPEQVFADKSIKCVFVEVTNDDLIPVAKQCAEHNLAMHLEKPCGQTLQPFVDVVDICRRRGIPLQIGYMFRVNPAIRFCQKIVKKGWLGNIVNIEADMDHNYGSKNYPKYIGSFKGGQMYNLGCHLIDFIMPMMPGMPERAHFIKKDAIGDPKNSGTHCISVLEWPHATVTLRSARRSACNSRLLRIQGTEGAVDLRPIERFDGKPTMLELRLNHSVGGYKKGVNMINTGIQKDRYADQLKELAQIIRGEKPNPDYYDHDIAVHKATLMACDML